MKIIVLVFSLVPILTSNAYSNSKKCGTSGTLQERIRNCDFKKDRFQLVTRTKPSGETYLDTKTNILWSDSSPEILNHSEAIDYCHDLNEQYSELLNVKWSLPTKDDYLTIHGGAQRNLPNFGLTNSRLEGRNSSISWSSTDYENNPDEAWAFGFGLLATSPKEVEGKGIGVARCISKVD